MQKTQGGGNTLTYLLSMIAMFCMISNVSAEVIDLEGQTIDVNGSAFKSNYNGHTIENGSVNLTGVADNENIKQGVFTIGNGATVKSTGEFRPNHDCTFYLKNGGAFSTDVVLCIPFRYGNSSFIMDGGTFTSSATQTYTGGYSVNIGYVWNNKTVWADNSAQLIMNNGSVFNVTQGTLCFGKSKSHEKKVNLKVDVAVTNSSIVVSKGQIVLSNNDNAWITDNAKSYVKVVFGPDSHITTGQIYADGIYPTPSVIFDGATIHWTGNNSSFIGHRNTAGDIYTIDSHGLTVDIPKGKALTCDSNASSLKGEGGITKIGEGSITWNKVSSGGSSGMTFTGPLTVTEGTWSSSLGYASKVFNVSGKGSVLELSGALSADEINFNVSEGGLLKLTGATTPNDTAPDMSISAGGVLEDVSTEPRTFSALALGEGCAVKVAGGADGVVGILADELALSATEENQVALKFSSATEIPVGTYAVITINGEGAFTEGDDKKFSLEEIVPENSQLTLSEDKKSLLLIVPATNPATWIGNAGDGKFSTAGNWLGGKVPGADDEIDIKAASDIELECDTSIAVKAISIHPESAKVTINGAGSITLSEKIVNASEKMMTVNVPVEFKTAEGGDAAIDVTGEVDFQGGVKGTVPVNHTTFYGKYTLTAEKWILSQAITLAEGAVVKAEKMKLELDGNKLLCAKENSFFDLNELVFVKAGDMFDTYLGTLQVSILNCMKNSTNASKLNDLFKGVLRVDVVKGFVRSGCHEWNLGGDVVIGETGIRSAGGGWNFGSSGKKCVLHSSADWTIENDYKNSPHNGYYNYGFRIKASSLDINTTDYDDSTIGRTVTVKLGDTKASAEDKTLLDEGDNSAAVSAFGIGTFAINNKCYFTGGFTASNGVTVTVNKNVYPGKGDVTIRDTATLKLVDSASGTVPVAGKLTMEGGSTLHVPQFSASVVPISVNSLEFTNDENNKKVALNIEGGELVPGFNAIIQSTTALPANAWDNFAVTLGATVPSGMETLYIAQGNTLYIVLKGGSDAIWSGGGETANFNNSDNWLGGQIPGNGSCVQIAAADEATLVNDIPGFSPASITFAAGSTAVTITGENAINVTSITNLSSASHTINVPVYFTGDIQVKQAAMAETGDLSKAHVTFAGGAHAAEGFAIENGDFTAVYSRCMFGDYYLYPSTENPWTALYQGNGKRLCLAENSTLHITHTKHMTELYVGANAKVYAGNTILDGRLMYNMAAGGEMIITNMTLSGTGDRYLSYNQGTSNAGVFKFDSVTNSMSKNWFYFADAYDKVASKHTIYIGAGGLSLDGASGSGAYCIGRNYDGNAETIRPWYSDFTIGARSDGSYGLVINRDVMFNTDDENGVGRKITVDAVTRGNSAPTITVSGSGTVLVNSVASNNAQPPVSVIDTATLAYKPGASLGSGLTTINAGAMLQVAESGEVALGGDLTLKNGACLGFNYTTRNPPVLNLTDRNITFEEGESTNIVVKISSSNGKRPYGGVNVLTSGGKFSGVTVSKAADNPDWVKDIYVDDNGNIVFQAKPRGTRIIVR